MRKTLCIILGITLAAIAPVGCQTPVAPTMPGPTLADYGRKLPAGRSSLRVVRDPAAMPDLATAYRNHDALTLQAMDRSIAWFDKPSSKTHFPKEGVTHDQARMSLVAFRDLLAKSTDATAFSEAVRQQFDVFSSVGWDGDGTVLYTGYYAPVLNASRKPTARFSVPLYERPADLATEPSTGRPLGRKAADGSIVPYATRREIEEANLLTGTELIWLENELDAYLVHVNGSAKLRLQDGSVMYIGYAGKTDRPYASLGQALVAEGVLPKGGVSLARIKTAFRQQPSRVHELMYVNENYVFFREYDGGTWPAGSLGVPVTAETSVATDKTVYPRGGVVLVDTKVRSFTGDPQPMRRFMLDQDTGGAIQAPGRADLFMGVGPGAEILAGQQYAEGKLYYFFLKPSYAVETKSGNETP